ncbi:hypothetical protein JR590_002948 [Listeria monocytogenes]|uniref:hypothetical protein n=1 Tax=Listeria innocua TaxID=1642 RepID=UPI001627C65F|nr:hypothetical protein [Listeria innocua]EHD1589158.1 hypothetical protein [Listeria monocytogenes]EHK4067854.1 hypothetical protein [Listeria monocytogenes]MBC2238751.1 hypothetical protein [Listeria innocua]HBC0574086.1 hypothetical protein [Listeria monocytogenes]
MDKDSIRKPAGYNREKRIKHENFFSIIIETLDFVESKLNENINSLVLDDLKIKKSIFLNIFIITNEFR